MKNIFKFLGIALVASTMMIVACNPGDKNEENEDQNNQQQQEEQIPDGVKVTFGNDTWTPVEANYCYTFYYAGNGIMSEYYKGNTVVPGVSFVTRQLEAGTETATAATANPYSLPATGKIRKCEYNYESLIFFPSEIEQDENGDYDTTFYGDYWPLSVTSNIKALDADNLKITAVVEAELFNSKDVFVQNGVEPSAATRKNLKLTLGNVTMVTNK